MYASQEGHLDVVRALVDSGADFHAKSNDGKIVYIFICFICVIQSFKLKILLLLLSIYFNPLMTIGS